MENKIYHYFKLKKFSLFNNFYVVADCVDALSLMDEQYHVKLKSCFVPDDEQYKGYVALVVKVPKRFAEKYEEEVLENMPKFAALRSYDKYEEFSSFVQDSLVDRVE